MYISDGKECRAFRRCDAHFTPTTRESEGVSHLVHYADSFAPNNFFDWKHSNGGSLGGRVITLLYLCTQHLKILIIKKYPLFQRNMVAIFLALLREMKNYHYGILISSLKAESAPTPDPYKQGLLKFLNDVLVVMRNLFHPSYFPNDWNTMILLQNRFGVDISILIGKNEHLKNCSSIFLALF